MIFSFGLYIIGDAIEKNNPAIFKRNIGKVLKINGIIKEQTENERYLRLGIQCKSIAKDKEELLQLNSNLWVNVKKEHQPINLEIGSQVTFTAQIAKLGHAKNPHQFDFGQYLKSKGYFYQSFIYPKQLISCTPAPNWHFKSICLKFRKYCQGILKRSPLI